MARAEQTAGPSSLSGGRLVLAAAYALALPLVLIAAAVVLLTSRMGELPALAIGLAAALVALLPGLIVRLRSRKQTLAEPLGDET